MELHERGENIIARRGSATLLALLFVAHLSLKKNTRADARLDGPSTLEGGAQGIAILAMAQLLVDSGCRCKIGSAPLLSTLPGLVRKDVASHISMERLDFHQVLAARSV